MLERASEWNIEQVKKSSLDIIELIGSGAVKVSNERLREKILYGSLSGLKVYLRIPYEKDTEKASGFTRCGFENDTVV